ncbi:hypothetical protein B0H13DRAFT_719210 [Mycena leptocephala]|nr:hypothetical protein B0H13DRAFT_719210 [Mycena leptocephala]
MAPTSASDPVFPFQLFIRILEYIRYSILEYLRYIARRPSSPWRKPEMTTPHEDRLALVQSAIDVSLQEKNLRADGQFVLYPEKFWDFAGWLYGQMAKLDGASNPNTNETKYRYPEMIADYFAQTERHPKHAGFVSQFSMEDCTSHPIPIHHSR